MRFVKYLFFLLFSTSLLSACQKDEIPWPADTALTGKWQWVSSNGGITGQDSQTPASTNTTIVIQFTADKKFIRYENGVKTQEDTYRLVPGKSIYDASGKTDLITINSQGIRYSYQLTDNLLLLFDECSDCYTHQYVRMEM